MSILYIVATPIGNLEDISLRALRVLRQVGLVAAEDTRTTRNLLGHFDIHTPLVAYTDAYQRNILARAQGIQHGLAPRLLVALVSEAGLPGVSDPGYQLVAAVLAAGHELVVVPGPSAVTTALVASGLPCDRFLFVGFLPRKAAERRAFLAQLLDERATLVMFEAPHRLPAALADLLATLGNRPAAVARELTKRFEEVWRGRLAEAVAHFEQQPARGEITLVVGGAASTRRGDGWLASEVVKGAAVLQGEGLAPAAVARALARLSGWPRSAVYDLLQASHLPSDDAS